MIFIKWSVTARKSVLFSANPIHYTFRQKLKTCALISQPRLDAGTYISEPVTLTQSEVT
jgi:hypothetical protein